MCERKHVRACERGGMGLGGDIDRAEVQNDVPLN